MITYILRAVGVPARQVSIESVLSFCVDFLHVLLMSFVKCHSPRVTPSCFFHIKSLATSNTNTTNNNMLTTTPTPTNTNIDKVGTPCWNSGDFSGLSSSNANVSKCWSGGDGSMQGGTWLNNHNWVNNDELSKKTIPSLGRN